MSNPQQRKQKAEGKCAYLENLEEFLLFKHCVFQVHRDSLLVSRRNDSVVAAVLKLIPWESLCSVESIDHLHVAGIRELTFHEELRVLA